MNKIYRVVWNAELGQWVVASEVAKGKKKKAKSGASMAMLMVPAVAVMGSIGYAPQALASSADIYGCNTAGSGQGFVNWTTTNGLVTYGGTACAPGAQFNYIGGGNIEGEVNWVSNGGDPTYMIVNSGNVNTPDGVGSHSIALRARNGIFMYGQVGMAGNKIVSMAKGTSANDAVNVSQLTGVTNALGGGAAVSSTGAVTAPAYTINGTTYNNVGAALTALSTATSGDALKWSTSAGAYDATHGGTASKIINVADGNVASGSKEAVNGGQLFTTNQNVTNLTNNFNTINPLVEGLNKYFKANSTAAAASAEGTDSVAIGGAATAKGERTVALGGGATTGAESASALGYGTSATGNGSLALGTYADASATYSVALGADSEATASNTVSLGNDLLKRRITNLDAGIDSTDAVNVQQLKGTAQSVANAFGGGSVVNNDGTISAPKYTVNKTEQVGVDAAIAALDGRIDNLGPSPDALTWDGAAYNATREGEARRITGVADGVNASDAINKGQFDKAVQPLMPALKYLKFGQSEAADAYANGQDTIAIGGNAFATANKGIAIGANANASAVNSVAVGYGSTAGEANTFAVGGTLPDQHRRIVNVADGVEDTDAATVGQLNDKFAEAMKSASMVKSGGMLKSSGLLGATLAATDLIKAGETIKTGATVAGVDSLAAGLETKAMKDRAIAIGNAANAAEVDSVAIGQNVVSNGVQAVAIGSQVQAFGGSSIAIGTGGTQVTDTGSRSTAIGYKTVLGGTNTVAIGGNIASSASNSVLLGNKASDGKRGDNIVSVGSSGGERQVIFVKAGTQDTDAVNVSQLKTVAAAIGGGSAVDADGKVTLPTYKIDGTDTTGTLADGISKLDQRITDLPAAAEALLWDETNGVYTAKHDTTNAKIANLAAGTVSATSADAINGSQLYTTNKAVADILGGNEGGLNTDGTIKAPTFTVGDEDKATVGEAIAALDAKTTEITTDALMWDTNAYSAKHGDANAKITNLAAGAVSDTSVDAINGSQLYATNKVVSDVLGGKDGGLNADGTIKAPTYEIGDKTYASVGDALAGIASDVVGVDAVKWDSGINAYSAKHGDANAKIANLAAGTVSATSADAINGSQLYTSNKAVADILGGNEGGLNTDGTIKAPTFTVGDEDKATVGEAIAALDAKTTEITTDALMWDTNAYSAKHGDANAKITNLAAGAVSATSVDAINGSQLYTTNKAVADILGGNEGGLNADGTIKAPTFTVGDEDKATVGEAIAALDAKTTEITTDALMWDTNAYSAKHGDANAKITNLAAGAVSATSVDAINGSQLYATNKAVSDALLGTGAVLNDDGTIKPATFTVGGKTYNSVNEAFQGIGDAVDVDAIKWDAGIGAYSAKHGGNDARITNVAAGAVSGSSKDAINGSQLFNTANSMATALGGTASVNPETGSISKPEYTVDGSKVMGVDGAIAALDSKMDNVLSDSLQWDPVSKAYSASHDGAQLNKIINVADGTNPNDAINKAQLDKTVAPLLPALKYVRFGGTNAADAFANGQDTIAIGGNAFATADKGLAIGANASASAINSVAIGFGSSAGEANTFAVGGILPDQHRRIVNVADGVDDTDAATVGQLNNKFAEAMKSASMVKNGGMLKSSTLLGATLASTDLIKSGDTIKTGATASGADSLAAGLETRAMKDRAIAIGNVANAAEVDSVAIGQNVVSNGVQAVAIGSQVQSFGASAIAIGTGGTQVADTGARSTAIGYKTVLGGTDTVAIGNNIVSSVSNAVLLGNKASDGKRGDNIVSVGSSGGERQVIFVKAGTQDTDAVNVSQLKSVTAALGGNAKVDSTNGAVMGPKYEFGGKTYTNVGDALSALASETGADALMWDTAAAAYSAKHGGANAKVTHLAAGTVGATSVDAINGSQLYATNKAVSEIIGGTQAGLNDDGSIKTPTFKVDGQDKTSVADAIGALEDLIETGSSLGVAYDSDAKDAITLAGANGTTIGNLAAGVEDDDAASVGQLRGIADALGGGAGIDDEGNVTPPTYTVAGKDVHSVAEAVTGLDGRITTVDNRVTTITNNYNQLASDSLKWNANAAGGAAYSAAHGTQTESRITNVANATQAKDAVNKGQMDQAISDALTDPSTRVLAVKYDTEAKESVTLGGSDATKAVKLKNVADATAGDEAVNLGQLQRAGLFDEDGKPLDAVVYDANTSKASVTFGGANGTVLNNVADGLITRDSRQAVNGGQIFALKEQLNSQITNLDNRVTNIEVNGGGGSAPYISANPQAADIGKPTPANAGDTAGIAMGYSASASGDGASAMGDHAVAQAKDSVAIGNNTTVTETAANSVALGNGSVADAANTVSIGSEGHERTISHVARGNADTDAATMGQVRESLTEAKSYTDSRLNDVWQGLGEEIDAVNRQANRGIAAASALITVTPYVPGHTTVNAGMANYRGETALGIGVSRWSDNGRVNFNAGVSAAKDDEPVFRVGVGYIF
ncbi:ESPR-type extended signal peptide-containing protein [Lysobacter arvi]|uniref:ESPR-type extended signal peptide-containing protein n=1 Tax=Lysobacter arvi TaxID=3038776 RepID=A0ABU1CIB4_9GAMM|nr:ESPR-type extended signal peptide-containing protein [Lysobacter arvi]MDR0184691.1 ESPR-type extended signal peptide-containing protein [Lysobacter arvi]